MDRLRDFIPAVVCGLLLVSLSPTVLAATSSPGRTPGQADVSARGEATYSIPIAVPPGTHGLAPAISLEYRHGLLGGIAGAGWSIGGLSAISRCARTVAQDGEAGPVTRTLADRFCLDGQRLVAVDGGAYGSAGTEYRTEVESFARIRSYDTAGAGPQKFVVELADGRVLEYGATTDSRIDWAGRSTTPRAWAVNRMRDRSGNVVDYAYSEDATNGSFRVASVRYNANPAAGLAATHEIAFTYESRPADDVDLRYVTGLPVREASRLDRIDVLYQGALLRRYELDYEAVPSSAGRSRLASIRECGRGLQECLAPTMLAWQDGAPGLGPEQALELPMGDWSIDEAKRWWIADVNGDGRDDVAWAGGSQSVATLHFRLALAGGGFGSIVNTGVAAPEGAGVPLDYDGDGIRDALLISASGRWQVILGGASGLVTAIDTGISATPIDFRGADLNGDGLSDLVYSEAVGHSGNGLMVRVRYNTRGAGFAATPVTLYEQGYYTGYPVAEGGDFLGYAGEPIDLDGDGREDLLMNENYSVARISASEQMSEAFDGSPSGGVPADYNGDGCTDLAYPHHLGRWRVRLSGCLVRGPTGVEIVGPAYDLPSFPLAALDWNGDGRDDIFYADTSARWKVVLSTGERLLPVLDTGLAQGSSTGLVIGDVDGDGLEDLVTRSASRLAYRLHAGAPPDLLATVQDGFGVGAAFAYSSLRDPAVHARGSGAAYPQREVTDGRQVVARLSVTDGSGTGASRLTTYSYAGLRADATGRGDLGFARRVAREEATNGLVVEESYRQDFPFIGHLARHVLKRPSGAVVHDIAQTWQHLALGTAAATRYFPYLSSSRDQRYEPAGASGSGPHTTIAMSVAAIDPSSGLVTDRSVTVTEGPGGDTPGASRTERVEVASVLNDTVNWCLGRPQSTSVTASHTLPGGDPIARQATLAWEGPGCRLSRLQVEPGSPEWRVTVDLGYDGFGNVSRRSVTGAGMAARTTTLDWGPRGRLPRRATNALSQSFTATWEEGFGVPASLSDPNGLTTRWSYDGLAQPLEVTRPDGVRVTWSRIPCAAGCDPRARYRLAEEERGPAGEIGRSRFADMDAFDRPVRTAVKMPGSGLAETLFEFDAWGRAFRQHRPAWSGGAASGYWQYSYDDLGRLVTAALHEPGGALARSTRMDHDGLSVTETNPRGNATTRRVTAWGDVASVTDPLRGETRYQFDAFGHLTEVRDGTGNVTARVSWNVRGMKTGQWDMDLGSWTLGRNALGELLSQRDARGQSVSFEYDALGRLLRRTEPEGVTAWTWGASALSRSIGRLASVAGPGYSERYAYDSLGRLAARYISTDASYQYNYAYDSLGRVASLTYPASVNGFRLKLGYDYADGQVIRVRNLSASDAPVWELGAADAAGNVLDESLGGTLRVLSGYSPTTGDLEYRQAGRGSSATIQDLAYRWDSAGNLLERRDLGRQLAEAFGYDAADRLEQATSNGVPTLGLRYDLTGNITWKSDVCPTSAGCFGYDPVRRHAVIAAGANRYGYDANGNMVDRAGATIGWYSYNLPNTIVQGGSQSQLWYGPDRNRWKQVTSSGGVSEKTIYAGGLLEKVTRSGKTIWRHYLLAPTGTAAVHLRHADGSAPETFLITHDHLGSTDRIVDAATGVTILAESFDPFGRRRGSNGSGVPGTAEWDAIGRVTRDGFTGHEHLDNVGLVHMNGRVYDPVIGRFLSPDPVIQAPFSSQDLNRYAYAWNNPLSVVDPTGLEEVQCLHGPNGRCQGVTVTGLRAWPEGPAYRPWRTGGNGQPASAGERDPCGQDGSAAACAGAARKESPTAMAAHSAPAMLPANGDYWQGLAASLGNLGMNSVPAFWLFGLDDDFEWFPVPDSEAGLRGATLGSAGYLAGGMAGAVRPYAASVAKRTVSSTAGMMRRFELPDTRVFYRVFSGEATVGSWLTAVKPRSSTWAQEALALPPRNQATQVQEVLVPRGTLLERSRASSVPEWGRMRGGAEQFKLLETIPEANFGPGSPLP